MESDPRLPSIRGDSSQPAGVGPSENLCGVVKAEGQDKSSLDDGWRLIEAFPGSRNMTDLEEGITLTRAGLTNVSLSSLDYAVGVDNLAYALKLRFEQRGETRDLDESITFQRETVKLFLPPDPKHFDCLEHLSIALQGRFQQRGEAADLNEAISLHRQAVELLPPHPNRVTALSNLGNALKVRFEQDGEPKDLDESISLHKEALQVVPLLHKNRFATLNNLATALHRRFEQRGDQGDINETILLHRQALDLLSPLHPNRPTSINNLAYALMTRYEQKGKSEDLDEAIFLHRQALELLPPSHPYRSGSLNNLANALVSRFEQQGKFNDLDAAVSFHREALELRPSPHPNRSQSLSNLGHVLQKRFDHQGEDNDLDESILLHRQVLTFFPPTHPYRSNALNNLANALRSRFQLRGEYKDLDETISLHRQALELVPPPHTNHSQSLNSLANALLSRFQQRDNSDDLDEAISLHKEALVHRPSPHPHRLDSLNNLARALETRFRHRKAAKDLDEAISLHRQTFKLFSPSHPERSTGLHNLASALMAQSQHRDGTDHLDEIVSLSRQPLELRPPPDPDRSTSLNNLANALGERFQQRGRADDLYEAIELSRQSLELIPRAHQNRPIVLQNFGVLEIFAHRIAAVGDSSHLEQAMSFLSEATNSLSLSPIGRFQIAETWSQYADQYQHPSALEAYDATLGVLPELAALNLNIQSRQNALTKRTDGVARKAASCAIRFRRFDKATEYLEAGRGVFWTQFLHLRSPFELLHDIAPELENNLMRVSVALEQGSHREIPIGPLNNLQKLLLEEEARRFEQLAKEWSENLTKVRSLDGFQDFLRPHNLSKLQMAAEGSPVVFLVANDSGSDCLIMTSMSVHHIPLPNLSTSTLSRLVALTQVAVSEHQTTRSSVMELVEHEAGISNPVIEELQDWMHEENERGMRRERSVPKLISSDDIFRFVLGFLWDKIVKSIIDLLGLQKSKKPQLLKWCPTGLFTFLPIHAAGRYDEEHANCTLDYIISSYTPTIGALLSQNTIASTDPFKMIIVVQSRTLPATLRELEKIEGHVPGDSLIKFGVPDAPASVNKVASHLSAASIVHFACHATQDPLNPLDSGLEIEGERLTITRIMKEAIPNGSLAFLSACETAVGDEKIPDEALNIGASLLFSGFHSVVATMRKMWDMDGPVIADAFYKELFKGPDGNPMLHPDPSKSAFALHVAVNELSFRGVPFKRWVPFIHMGK